VGAPLGDRRGRIALAVVALPLLLPGCVVPVAISAASAGFDGLTYIATGKSPSEHAISELLDQNCSALRIFAGRAICRDYTPEERRDSQLARVRLERRDPAESNVREPTYAGVREPPVALAQADGAATGAGRGRETAAPVQLAAAQPHAPALPARDDRDADMTVPEPVSSEVRGRSAASIGDPVEVAQSESRMTPRLFHLHVGWEPTGIIDNELVKATDQELSFAGKAVQRQKVRSETSKASEPIFRQPRQPSTLPPTSTGPDEASQLASAPPGPWEQGPARGDATSAGAPSDAARTIVPQTASIGSVVEPAQNGTGSATSMLSGEGEGIGAVRLPDDTVSALLRRGDELLALGDLFAARLLYERAAIGGSARGATAAGKTYDPIFDRNSGVRGTRPDTVKALAWYRKAIEFGDTEAAARLKKLVSIAEL
jgi:hypothetical protein